MVVNDYVIWLRKNGPGAGFHVYRKDGNNNRVMAHMDVDEKWSNAVINCIDFKINMLDAVKGVTDWMEYYSFILMGIVFRNHLLNNNGIVIHASSIAWQNKGILFTAPSGTGKSTHVRLWEKYLGDEVTVINDDTPAIRFNDGVPTLCGTPWSGSSDKFVNRQVPLEALVIIEQAPYNKINRLSPVEALPKIMPRIFLPYFDVKLMEKAYDILDRIITKIPIYILKCTPEKEAMELVHECIK